MTRFCLLLHLGSWGGHIELRLGLGGPGEPGAVQANAYPSWTSVPERLKEKPAEGGHRIPELNSRGVNASGQSLETKHPAPGTLVWFREIP